MTIIDTIQEGYSTMSRTQKRIADFLLENPEEACFLSLRQLSERMGTTEVTVLNFSRKVGYDSFLKLKKELQAYISMRLSPSEKIATAISSYNKDRKKVMEHVFRQDLDAIERSYRCLNDADLDRTIALIRGARRIHLAAHKGSRAVSMILRQRLEVLGLDAADFLIEDSSYLAPQLLRVSPRDLFILISFPTYHPNVLALAELLHQQGVPSIVITDRAAGPMSQYADATLVCATDTAIFYNSYVAPMLLADLLASAIAIEMEGQYDHVQLLLRQYTASLRDIDRRELERQADREG